MGAEHFGDLQVAIQTRVVFFCFRTEKTQTNKNPSFELGRTGFEFCLLLPHFVILGETVTVSVLPFPHLEDEYYTMPWHVALLSELSPTLMELATAVCGAQTTHLLMHMLILGHTVLWQPSRDELLPSVCFTCGTLGYTGQMSGAGEIAQLVNCLLHKVRTQVQSPVPPWKVEFRSPCL